MVLHTALSGCVDTWLLYLSSNSTDPAACDVDMMSSLLAELDIVTAVVGRAEPGGGSGAVGCTPQRLEELVRWDALYVVSVASWAGRTLYRISFRVPGPSPPGAAKRPQHYP